MHDKMRLNTPPPIMESDSDDDIPVGEDDLEIIDDAEIEAIELENELNDSGEESMDDDENYSDDSILTFDKHTDSVYCCAINKSNTMIVSGGGDDKAYVWDLETGNVIFECREHQDSVEYCSFNHDGTLVATGDMKGIIKVWKVETKSKIWEFETTDLGWMQWHKAANILLAGTTDGDAWMWLIPSGITKTFPSFGSPVSAGSLLHDGKRMFLGYEDGSLRLWDLKEVGVIFAITDATAHTEGVTKVDCSTDNSLLASGSVDGTVKIITTNSGKVLNTIEIDSSSIETLAFSSRSSTLAIGTLNGTITIWDVPSKMARHTVRDDSVIVKIVWQPDGNLFYAACLDRVIKLWDSLTGEAKEEWRGHKEDILDLILTSDGQKFITSSEDKTCKVFKVNSS